MSTDETIPVYLETFTILILFQQQREHGMKRKMSLQSEIGGGKDTVGYRVVYYSWVSSMSIGFFCNVIAILNRS